MNHKLVKSTNLGNRRDSVGTFMELLAEQFKRLKAKYGLKANKEKSADFKRDSEKRILENFNNRIGDLNKYDHHECLVCKNRGSFMKIDEKGYLVNVPCKCMETRKMLRKLKKSGLSTNLQKLSFNSFLAEEPWQEALKKAALNFTQDDQCSWFFIGGQSGCGKTHLCTAITAYYLGLGKSAHYMLWRDEITKIKSAVTDFSEYTRLVDPLKKVDVLYIDDLFKTGNIAKIDSSGPTIADVNIAFEVLNSRYIDENLITIISSELVLKDIAKIDDAVAGRIAEKTGSEKYCLNLPKDSSKNYRYKNRRGSKDSK